MPQPSGSTPKTSANKSSSGWRNPSKMHFAIVIAALIIVVGAVIVLNRHNANATSASKNGALSSSASQIRVSGIPSSISTPLANLMELSPSPATKAPNFTLTDQNGKTMSLSSFKGKSVVLEFMDPKCTDICPLVSEEFVNAYHDLGKSASQVVFIAVNVNRYHLSTSAVNGFTVGHGLNQIPNWHFFTGSYSALSQVWKNYGITVQSRGPNADVIHSSIVFFIGPNGHERFIATPTDYHTKSGTAYLPASQLVDWGKGIALVSKNMVQGT